MMSLLKLFRQQNWRVVFATPAQKSDYMADLEREGIESVEILLNDSSFDRFVAGLDPDYVLFDRFMMEEQFSWRVSQACPRAVRILDTEDLQCLRNARHQALKENRQMSRSDLSSELAKRECAAIFRSDLSLIISEYELALLQEAFKVDPMLLHYLPFMLDVSGVQPDHKPFSERAHFVTIGNFRHAPNWDSVLYLQQIWPLIREALPDAELHIYGAYPPKKAMALNNSRTGFLVKGWAEDASRVLEDARVCLSPLRFGAGIKGKLVEAMLSGTPSVTTDIGAESMAGELSWPGLIANTESAIAKAAVTLYTDQSAWQGAQDRIAPILRARYNGESIGQKVIDRFETVRTNLEQHRLNNFIGKMLNHHLLKSAMYMSKWIEAKNELKALKKSS